MYGHFDEPNRVLNVFLNHGKREHCYLCGYGEYGAPFQPVEVCCSYGHAFLSKYNALITKGWKDMRFWDGEPEDFSEPELLSGLRSW